MSAPGTRVSLITVTYQSEDLVEDAIASAIHAADRADVDLEIIVVDNASSDSSALAVARSFPNATVIRNPTNVGFGRATNQGVAVATGEYVLLLNPDARIHATALNLLIAEMRRLGAAAVAPSIGTQGAESAGMAPTVASAAGHFLGVNRLLLGDRGGQWRGVQLRRRAGRPRRVDWASAAVLLVDVRALAQVGGFDERIFLYGEDVDLGMRLNGAGHSVWLVPAAKAEHLIAASQGGVSARWVDALHTLHARTARPANIRAFNLIMAVGLTARAFIARMRTADQQDLHVARMRAAAKQAWSLVARAEVKS